jgi:uroporphyrinogen-III decarboxylase
VKRNDYLDLAGRGVRMPVGADLVLHDQPDRAQILIDGRRLGAVVAAAAREFRTPLAVPLMDLTIEKAALLEVLGVPAADIPTYHFAAAPGPDVLGRLADGLPAHRNARLDATCDAIRYVADETDLEPIGMVIGPLSLVTKLLADPITAIFMAGRGRTAADCPPVALLEAAYVIAARVIRWSLDRQLAAGARAIFVCEPAASVAYLSPRQIAAGVNLLERFVLGPNRAVAEQIQKGGGELIFHCCGELTPDFVRAFTTLRPVLLSLGSSRNLWEDAALVPRDIVLYGNLPTKTFYSDETCPLARVEALTRELLTKMRATGHPFMLGSECDVLSVPGAHETIRRKVAAFMAIDAA